MKFPLDMILTNKVGIGSESIKNIANPFNNKQNITFNNLQGLILLEGKKYQLKAISSNFEMMASQFT